LEGRGESGKKKLGNRGTWEIQGGGEGAMKFNQKETKFKRGPKIHKGFGERGEGGQRKFHESEIRPMGRNTQEKEQE